VDAISNNLANVATPAYKRTRVSFDDVLYRAVGPTLTNPFDAEADPAGVLGGGTVVSRVDRLFTQGALQATQRPLDLAIQGNGFFEVERADGTLAYTRAGGFLVNDTGELVTFDGSRIQPGVRIPPDAIEVLVSETGDITARVPDAKEPVVVGRLELAQFMNTDGLKPIGQGLYQATVASGDPFVDLPGQQGLGTLKQGFLEASNVDFSQELVELLLAQRSFQLSAKMVQASDEMLGEINSLRR
jgi:flagellar basal-body rod protein FlgG